MSTSKERKKYTRSGKYTGKGKGSKPAGVNGTHVNGSKPHKDDGSLPDAMADVIIRNAEEKIDQFEKQKAEMMPQYEKDKTFYEEAKRDFEASQARMDAVDAAIAEQRNVTEMVNRFRKADPASKKNVKRLAKSIPNADKVQWIEEAEQVLRDSYTWMTLAELWDKIIAKPQVRAKAEQSTSFKSNMKYNVMNTLKGHATEVLNGKKRTQRFIPTLTLYKGHVGLVEWVDKTNTPVDAKQMKQFMFAATKNEEPVLN